MRKLNSARFAYAGHQASERAFLDTLKVAVADKAAVQREAVKREVNFRYFADNHVGISIDETTSPADVNLLLEIFAAAENKKAIDLSANGQEVSWPAAPIRKTSFLTHPVFNAHHSEHEMLRYIKRLENKDLSMVHSMISLGSCTMKLNATAEMIPVTWPEFGNIHPFAPTEQTQGYAELTTNLENWLKEITGFTGVSLQPNSGAQGEYAGLMVIRAYHEDRGEAHRTISPDTCIGTRHQPCQRCNGRYGRSSCEV